MGALCGKPSRSRSHSPDPFAQPGRTLGSAPPPKAATVGVPPKIRGGPGGPVGEQGGGGHTLGGAANGRGDGNGNGDAKSAAARAAEERAAKAQRAPTGKLGRDLASQKAQTRTETLENFSKDERRRRDADGVGEARNWN